MTLCWKGNHIMVFSFVNKILRLGVWQHWHKPSWNSFSSSWTWLNFGSHGCLTQQREGRGDKKGNEIKSKIELTQPTTMGCKKKPHLSRNIQNVHRVCPCSAHELCACSVSTYPTSGGMQNGSSVGRYSHCIHIFCMFDTNLHAPRVLINKISATKFSQKSIKSALLVGKDPLFFPRPTVLINPISWCAVEEEEKKKMPIRIWLSLLSSCTVGRPSCSSFARISSLPLTTDRVARFSMSMRTKIPGLILKKENNILPPPQKKPKMKFC